MPSYARKYQLDLSMVYHVYNRSNNKVPIFKRSEDFLYFMELLRKYSRKFCLKIYHWVIMTNHYHLLLELEKPKQISKIMAGLSKSYSCHHHQVYSSAGYLWQGRFKMQPIQKESYLFACGRYIERNPVRAGIVNEIYEYSYSSARYYCLGENDGITTEDQAFRTFGQDAAACRIAYVKFMSAFDGKEETLFRNLEHPAGNENFIKSLLKNNGRFTSKRSGRPSKNNY